MTREQLLRINRLQADIITLNDYFSGQCGEAVIRPLLEAMHTRLREELAAAQAEVDVPEEVEPKPDYYNSIPADQINRHWNEIITKELVKRARERWGDGDSTVVALQKNIGNFVVALSRFHSDRVGRLFDGWTEWQGGARAHYVGGNLHCETGPAEVWLSGRRYWSLNGKLLSESEWKSAVENLRAEREAKGPLAGLDMEVEVGATGFWWHVRVGEKYRSGKGDSYKHAFRCALATAKRVVCNQGSVLREARLAALNEIARREDVLL